MAIVKMSKFTLFSFQEDKEKLLDALHKFEMIQFDEATEEDDYLKKASDREAVSKVEGELAKLKFSIDLLGKYIPPQGTIEKLKTGKKELTYNEMEQIGKVWNFRDVYSKLKSYNNQLLELSNEKNNLQAKIEALLPWIGLDVSSEEIRNLKSCDIHIGTIPKNNKVTFTEAFNSTLPYSYLEFIGEGKDEVTLLSIAHKDLNEECTRVLKEFGFNKSNMEFNNTPVNEVKISKKRIDDITIEENKVKDSIKAMANSLENLEIAYEYYLASESKAQANDNFLKTESTICIKGWCPTENASEFEEIVKKVTGDNYYLEVEEASKEEDAPILLKNNNLVTPFEPITEMYSLPKYGEIDPTPLFTPFYLVFFGMMIADVGYGLLMFIGSFFALKKFNLDDKAKTFARFFMYLSIPSMGVGFLYGGFFGDAIPIKGLVDPAKDTMTILLISIVLGLIQIYVGLGIKGYMLIRDGKPKDAIYDVLFWYLALTGSIVYVGSIQGLSVSPTVANIFKWIMIVGMVGLVLTQGRENKGIGAKLGGGLYGLYGISGYVGDFVSYSRLMALGLAGGFIGAAFNMIIGMMPSPFNIIAGIIIFPVGHVFNMLLSMLSGYVHSCRLQYVEYFGKFYEGGGKAFTPFKTKSEYIKVKKN